MKHCFLILIALILAGSGICAQDAYKLDEPHGKVLQSWLAKNPGWRLASMNDYDAEIIKFGIEQEGAKFVPFYAAADFNYDGKVDFAVVLVSTRRKRSYAAAIFNAPFDVVRKNRPTFFVPNLQEGDGVFFRDKLMIGPYASDNIFIVSPVCATYKIEIPEFGDQ